MNIFKPMSDVWQLVRSVTSCGSMRPGVGG
jgi:hypothetical protein